MVVQFDLESKSVKIMSNNIPMRAKVSKTGGLKRAEFSYLPDKRGKERY